MLLRWVEQVYVNLALPSHRSGIPGSMVDYARLTGERLLAVLAG